MTGDAAATGYGFIDRIASIYNKLFVNPAYRPLLLLLGAPITLILFGVYQYRKTRDGSTRRKQEIRSELAAAGMKEQLLAEAIDRLSRKHRFFGQSVTKERLKAEAERLAEAKLNVLVEERIHETSAAGHSQGQLTFSETYRELMGYPLFAALSFVLGLPMYVLMAVYANPYAKYIAERLFMALFVILGVAFLVFTILYISPMSPAANILGETATDEQITAFNRLYGLDQPYLVQLWNTIRDIFTFDLGRSFAGNEDVTVSIANKFPVTLTLTLISTVIAVIIALPIGIISATRPNSFFDYTFMFIALLGLSIPNFWQGLIFILNFSINWSWLPATYNPNNWLSAIMPIVVLGTGLTAAVARMTRSSTLEVIHEDYIITARAKGLARRNVLWKHAVGNALIPIITVIGLQFGGMLGGAAVTEKVFNINGIGSYIVDKQFIPDIPAIMGGVVYTAITISIVNVIVDLMYAFFDPRIRSKMKQY
ncbi:peptide ABC transporter permease [Paenibacillus agaridevorans]|uniref:Peptide ABC transporter permease n=1 Tax=Paenibacillus agaridevorans TaxID=171404 RepID=A0A2R5EWH6_9BACL|nr:ABC transporter permease [Paenibacillus agaridevorans]GBG11052.1 peptide ABC transporter permease [Paenibacillus agaridevorans]